MNDFSRPAISRTSSVESSLSVLSATRNPPRGVADHETSIGQVFDEMHSNATPVSSRSYRQDGASGSGWRYLLILMQCVPSDQPSTLHRTRTVQLGPRSVAVGDFNRDGVEDLVVAHDGTNNVSVLLGNGDG